jgi:hypothetical protein
LVIHSIAAAPIDLLRGRESKNVAFLATGGLWPSGGDTYGGWGAALNYVFHARVRGR